MNFTLQQHVCFRSKTVKKIKLSGSLFKIILNKKGKIQKIIIILSIIFKIRYMKNIIVTGAASGIGFEIAKIFQKIK